MSEKAQKVLDLLSENRIDHRVMEHRAVYTVEDMAELEMPDFDAVAKNLFVRDDKKRNYYLVVVPHEKRVELKSFSEKIGSTRLSFASENDLNAILGLEKGSVTPFGILNDADRRVQVILDKAFEGKRICVHPNENTASVWLDTSDLVAIIKSHGNIVKFLEI
jgi:Ala-tRNA(Pro) deacylase